MTAKYSVIQDGSQDHSCKNIPSQHAAVQRINPGKQKESAANPIAQILCYDPKGPMVYYAAQDTQDIISRRHDHPVTGRFRKQQQFPAQFHMHKLLKQPAYQASFLFLSPFFVL